MTEDDKKKAVAQATDSGTDLTPEDIAEAYASMSLRTLLVDATAELTARAQAKKPLVIVYKVPCPCGKAECLTPLAISITPFTEVYYDALRSKH